MTAHIAVGDYVRVTFHGKATPGRVWDMWSDNGLEWASVILVLHDVLIAVEVRTLKKL